jgi:hypothetical protein
MVYSYDTLEISGLDPRLDLLAAYFKLALHFWLHTLRFYQIIFKINNLIRTGLLVTYKKP